jgi:hypothetical protein
MQEELLKIPNGESEFVNGGKMEQHESHLKTGVDSDAPEEQFLLH